jgi:hypothetical protein
MRDLVSFARGRLCAALTLLARIRIHVLGVFQAPPPPLVSAPRRRMGAEKQSERSASKIPRPNAKICIRSLFVECPCADWGKGVGIS